MATQTRPRSNQNNNLIDTQHGKEEEFQCDKSIQSYQLNFARKFHENEVMGRKLQNRIKREIASDKRNLE